MRREATQFAAVATGQNEVGRAGGITTENMIDSQRIRCRSVQMK